MDMRLIFAALALAAAVKYQGIKEKLPLAVGPQPVPFSHKQHAIAGAKCADCHVGASAGERARLPDAARCMVCHIGIKKDSPPIRELARYQAEGKPVPWVRVYRVPDFVFFSHARHGKAGVDCLICHGPVPARDVLQKEVSTSMKYCVDCHRARKATVECSRCHELGQ